jgi:hypothetical protein
MAGVNLEHRQTVMETTVGAAEGEEGEEGEERTRPRDAPYARVNETSLAGRRVLLETYGCQVCR